MYYGLLAVIECALPIVDSVKGFFVWKYCVSNGYTGPKHRIPKGVQLCKLQ